MRLIAHSTLKLFWMHHADAKQPLLAWNAYVKKANWRSPAEGKADLGSASILQDGQVVFNVGGNEYGIIVWINFQFGIVHVRFVGTHRQYSQIDAQSI